MSQTVKPGYKQTEVGVIPEEWEVFKISEIFQFKQGVQSPVEQQLHAEKEGYKRFIRIIDITDPSVPRRYVEDPGKVHHVGPKNLFMVRYGSPGLLGYGHEGVIANNLFHLIPKKKIDSDFYFQYLSSRRSDIADISGSSTMPGVNFSTLSGLQLVYPPIPEQRAIAEALSSVDALLAALDRFITKKSGLKQAAMQRLLTGQTRLPGFTGEWDVVEIKTLYAEVFRKSPLSSADGRTLGDYPLFVSGGEPKRTDIALFKSTEALIITDGGVFNAKYFSGDFSVTDHCFVISLKGDMQFYFQWMSLRKAELDLMTFKGSGLRNLDKPSFGKVDVPLPPLPEQTAIATVLSDMDLELTALEQRRDKTRALKQGMMQELLTGRTRLV